MASIGWNTKTSVDEKIFLRATLFLMEGNQKPYVSRYSAGGDENLYMDEAKIVLKNKKNISDLRSLHLEEEKALARAYELLLDEVRSDTPVTSELIRHAHSRIFVDLYDWAGRWRTVIIGKPGVTWPPPDYLDKAMNEFEREVLSAYPAPALKNDKFFCEAIGHIQGEFLAIHPFREGNARAIKLVTDLLAVQTGRLTLVYDASDKGLGSIYRRGKICDVEGLWPDDQGRGSGAQRFEEIFLISSKHTFLVFFVNRGRPSITLLFSTHRRII